MPENREAGAYESFEGTAKYLHIPQQNWDNPTVRAFIELLNRVVQLQEDLSQADIDSSFIRVLGDRTGEVTKRYIEAIGMDPELSERYNNADLLLIVVKEILEDGFHGYPARTSYMKEKINQAIRGYGMRVIMDPEAGKVNHM